ncbi:mitochondrial carrier protein rim2 [Stemphylium lycopersici]|nr:mitochondrial carrier protein rim2 [Stemphylium lycopersici]
MTLQETSRPRSIRDNAAQPLPPSSRELGEVTPPKLPDGASVAKADARAGKSWAHFVAGGLGGMASATLTAPLDVLKTRLQSTFYQQHLAALRAARGLPPIETMSFARSSLLHIRETGEILWQVPRAEGWRALFKGLGPNLIGVVPARAINFFAYGNGKRLISTHFNNGQEAAWVHLCSAATAGIVTGTATNPIWLVKTRLQLDKNTHTDGRGRQYKNAVDCTMQTIRKEGVRGLYRGLTASYLGVTESTLQWMLYEQMKLSLARREERVIASGKPPTIWDQTVAWTGKLTAAGSAKFVAALITYPHEVVRTRLREAPMADGRQKYTGLAQCFRLIWKEEGMAALYGGLVPHMFRVVPSAAIMFGTYEARIPALQRQCLFLRHQYQSRPHNLSLGQTAIPATRAFSSTPSRPSKRKTLGQDKAQTRAAAEAQVGPAPNVNYVKAQSSTEAMVEDIGLLQNTIIRAPFSELKGNGVGGIARYYWDLLKSKGTALYSRYHYRACIQKTGWDKYFPVDPFNNAQYKSLAQKYYEQLYTNFAEYVVPPLYSSTLQLQQYHSTDTHFNRGNMAPLKQICLPPIVKKLEQRIAARGRVKMQWRLHGPFKSSRVVSHRAAPLGEEQPDTAYRQVVVRLVSEQSLQTTSGSSSLSAPSRRPATRRLPWMPDAARQQAEKLRQREKKLEDEAGAVAMAEEAEAAQNAVPKTVVEYLVLQKRVVRGKEEDWKVWGFAEESTPSVIARDQEYWRKMLDVQIGGA